MTQITRVLLLAWEWMDGRHLPGRHRQHTDRVPSIGDATCQCANGQRDSKQVGAGEEHALGISHDACTLRPGRKELGAGWPPARVEVREELGTPARCRLPASRHVSHGKREIERLSLLVDVCAARSCTRHVPNGNAERVRAVGNTMEMWPPGRCTTPLSVCVERQ